MMPCNIYPVLHFYIMYRVVQLNFTLEIEVLCMLFDRALSIFTMISIENHIKYFNFRSKIQLDVPLCQTLN